MSTVLGKNLISISSFLGGGLFLFMSSSCGKAENVSSLPDDACEVHTHDLAHVADASVGAEQSTTPQSEQENHAQIHHRPTQYFVELKLGDPNTGSQKIYEFVPDTGSANLIVKGDRSICQNCVGDGYKPGPSATPTGDTVSLQYGSGQGKAVEYHDYVGLKCGEPMPYNFEVITQATNLPNILGLAYASVGVDGKNGDFTPFLDQMKKNGIIQAKFSMLLCGTKKGSAINLGGNDDRVTDKDIKFFTPIITEDYYTVGAHRMETDKGESIGDFSDSKAIVDSGTTLNIVPTAMFDKIVALMEQAAQEHNVPINKGFWRATTPKDPNYAIKLTADQIKDFPVLTVVLGGMKEGEEIKLQMKPDTYIKAVGNGNRIFGFRSRDSNFILGQVFMENYYVLFDKEDDKIGFLENDKLCGALEI